MILPNPIFHTHTHALTHTHPTRKIVTNLSSIKHENRQRQTSEEDKAPSKLRVSNFKLMLI